MQVKPPFPARSPLSPAFTLSSVLERKGSLVNLERGQGNPSVAVLCHVAAALGVALADLVEHSADLAPTEFDPAGGRLVWRGNRVGYARLVVGIPAGRQAGPAAQQD